MPIAQSNYLPKVRSTDKLRELTEKAAYLSDEKLSEYIRKSVEDRNKKVLTPKQIGR